MRRSIRALAALGLLLTSVVAFAPAADARPCDNSYPPGLCYPTLAVSTTTPCVGETIQISGKKFYDSEPVKLTIAGQSVATAHTVKGGSFGDTPAVTPDAPGPAVVKGVGASGFSDDVATTNITIRTCHGAESTGLANTGVKIAGLGAIAIALIAGGVALVRGGRRKSSQA